MRSEWKCKRSFEGELAQSKTISDYRAGCLAFSQKVGPDPVEMKSRVSIHRIVRTTLLIVSFACTLSIAAQTRQWSAQPGTVDADAAGGLAVDSNYVYLVGTTAGTMGRASHGQRDAFLLQFDRNTASNSGPNRSEVLVMIRQQA